MPKEHFDTDVGALDGFTHEQIIDILNGDPPRDLKEQDRKLKARKKVQGLPVKEWPKFSASWTLAVDEHHFCLDGVNKQDFAKAYPNGLVAKWVRLDSLDAVLCNHNFRTAHEVWSVGDKSKAAKVLLDWIECRALTPPLLKPFSSTELCLHGGNHRLAVARANRELEIPVLIDPDDLDNIGQLVTLCDHPNGSVPTY